MKRSLKRFFAFSAVAIMLATGCTQTSNKNESPDVTKDATKGIERLSNKEEFIIAAPIYDKSFDPCTGWGYYAEPLFQSKLVKTVNTSLENDLATEYKVSEDGLTWTFKIRDDVKFHDGKPLTAKDVAFTFNKTKEIAGRVDLTTMDKAVAIDDTTVEFKMNAPFSSFLHTTASLGIVPEHAYVDSATYNKNPIGSGPLKFVQYDEGQQLIMERNDDYYGKKPNFKRFIILIMNDDTAYAAAKAGEVDLVFTNQNLAQEKIDGYTVKTMESYDYRVISMPTEKSGKTTNQGDPVGNDVTSDLAVRKALAVGINRKEIVDGALLGYGEPSFDIFSKLPWGMGEEVKNLEDGKVDEAKKILDDAGWVEGADGIREKDGIKAEFDVMYGSDELPRQVLAIAFSEQAKSLGIKVNPVGLDWSEIEKLAKSQPVVLGGGQYNPMNISKLFDSKYVKDTSWSNLAVYSNKETDEYIQKAINSLTEEEAVENWKKVLWDGTKGPGILGEVVYIPLCYTKQAFFVRDGVSLGEDVILPHDHGTAYMGDIVNWDYKG